MQLSQGHTKAGEKKCKSTESKATSPHPGTCWLAGSRLFQVVEGLVEVTQVVKSHSWSIESLEVLSFFLKHFEAVLLDSLIVHQLGLEEAGCRGWGWWADRQENISALFLPAPAICTGEGSSLGEGNDSAPWFRKGAVIGIVCQIQLFAI